MLRNDNFLLHFYRARDIFVFMVFPIIVADVVVVFFVNCVFHPTCAEERFSYFFSVFRSV